MAVRTCHTWQWAGNERQCVNRVFRHIAVLENEPGRIICLSRLLTFMLILNKQVLNRRSAADTHPDATKEIRFFCALEKKSRALLFSLIIIALFFIGLKLAV